MTPTEEQRREVVYRVKLWQHRCETLMSKGDRDFERENAALCTAMLAEIDDLQADNARLQAENARLRGLLGECRVYVEDLTHAAEPGYVTYGIGAAQLLAQIDAATAKEQQHVQG